MKHTTIYSRLIALLAILMLAVPLTAYADDPTPPAPVVRYVKTTANGGSSTFDGTSWATAMNDLQTAIDAVWGEINTHPDLPGIVYVAGYDAREEILYPGHGVGERIKGTYYPSKSLLNDASRQTYSFLMREGVTVYCGFEGNGNDPTKTIGSVTVPDPEERIKIYLDKDGHETSEAEAATWHMRYQTILSGNYQKQQNPNATEGVDTKFTWNEKKQKFDTEFPGNTSHVVSFASNGFYTDDDFSSLTDEQKAVMAPLIGHAKPLTKKAILDGAVIENGNAINNDLNANHPQNAYGGGIYMVPNAITRNCEVRYCAASRDGGGVYMDGGGFNDHLYVHHCQTLGIGIQHGYGGGVAVNNSGLVLHSFLINNVSRMGGGLSMKHDAAYAAALKAAITAAGGTPETITNGDNKDVTINPTDKYSAFCSATLIANNTATTEAGGVYLINGTGMNATTVARNRCNGSGARIDGLFTGTTGGVFAIGPARIYNSLFWGSSVGAYSVDANDDAINGSTDDTDDLQFSAYNDGTDSDKSWLYYVALNNSDHVNWSYSVTSNILALATPNGGNDVTRTYANLQTPSRVSGYDPSADYLADYNYQPNFNSALVAQGVMINDIGHTNVNVSLGETSTDVVDVSVSPRCDVGAYVAADQEITFRLMPNLEDPSSTLETPSTWIPTIFVDPNRHTGNAHDEGAQGHSWENPIMQLRNANNFFQEGQKRSNNMLFGGDTGEDPEYTYYDSPTAPTPVTGKIPLTKVQILMKEGTVYTVSTHTHARLRATSVFLIDNCAIYGGYYGGLQGTDLQTTMGGTLTTPVGRNPLVYRSVISGAAAGGDYDTNVARLVQVEGVSNTILDGVELRDANAAIKDEHNNVVAMNDAEALQYEEVSPMTELTTSQGAAIYIRNDLRHDEIGTTNKYRVDRHPEGLVMDNIQFRNCIIVGNTAEQGAAVWVSGILGTGGSGKISGLSFTNCIFHNNSVKRYNTVPETGTKDAGPGENPKATDGHGIIYAEGSALTMSINHCDFLRNVGNPIVIDNQATVSLNNSILYANLCQEVENTNDHDHYVMKSIVDTSGNLVTGTRLTDSHNNFFDKGAKNINDDLSAYGTVNLTYTYPDPSYTYPRFENPTKRSGVTPGGDITYYGYATSFMPMSMNPLTNAASGTGEGEYDLTTVRVRTYGGAPDCGAIENIVDQPLVGAVMYVRDYSATGSTQIKTYDKDGGGNLTENTFGYGRYAADGHELDGSSWRYAINGNIVYGQVDGKDVRGLQWAVDHQSQAYVTNNETENRQVWVGAGIYKADNLIKDKTGDKGNSCFIIRDHVNVYGSFPKIGNPGMDERHPLLSQYVFKPADVTDNVADFETILEPLTQPTEYNQYNNSANRVLGQPYISNPRRDSNGTNIYNPKDDFLGCEWDGFTLRKGLLDAKMINYPQGNGGSGLIIYKNVTARNMVITENTQFFNGEFRGGAVYIGGGTAENLYIINNKMHGWNYSGATSSINPKNAVGYGGGAYLRHECTMYNCVVYGNTVECNYADGAGLFLDGVATFFNNTIVKNVATGNASSIGGLATWTTGKSTQLNLYNCIIHGNTDNRKGGSNLGDQNIGIRQKGVINVINSLVESIPAGNKYGSGDKAIYYSTTAGQEARAASDAASIFVDVEGDTFKERNYRLLSSETNPAINTGLDAPVINGVTYDLSGYTDMDYAERIQDCRIDMGAYEYNGAMDINPELRNGKETVGQTPIEFDTKTDDWLIEQGYTAYFYVSENGRGNTRATNPANAACWKKIQKVFDSAGRYKFTHPGLRVVVKLAGTAENMDNETDESRIFKYSPRRSAVPENKDSREYSLLVPRGVEVWGGYYATNNTVKKGGDPDAAANDFLEANRDVIAHQTFLDGNYDTPTIDNLVAYHVLTFTDQIFDVNGIALTMEDLNKSTAFNREDDYEHPYTFGQGSDGKYGQINNMHVRDILSTYVPLSTGTENVHFASMEKQIASVANNKYPLSVIDGIFITGGKATGSSNATGSLNAYGGGAVVPDYAHIRNSIFMNNEAVEGGGALYLQPGALVTGTLFKKNTAAFGGAIYFHPWTTAELQAILHKKDVTWDVWQPYAPDIAKATATSMASVVTSTIVDNTATNSGGGVWFFDNARFNSSVLWGNHCGNMKNLTGQYSAHLGNDETVDALTTLETYPFSFSAVENLRVPGVNNLELSSLNSNGVRFTMSDEAFYDGGEEENNPDNIAPYYLPTVFSDLVNTGMSKGLYAREMAPNGYANADYESENTIKGYANADFTKVGRISQGYNKITIGARAQFASYDGPLLRRLYVAKSQDVDRVAQLKLQNLSGSDAYSKIYRQQGSSFAYPFKDLDDALAYIREHRKPTNTSLYSKKYYLNGVETSITAKDTDFEIIMAGGTYWPTSGIVPTDEYALGFTFLIPEGVKIIGGFDCDALTSEFVNNNGLTGKTGDINKFFGQPDGTLSDTSGTLVAEWDYHDMMLPRWHYDNNANNIVEPWEFTHRTILSGLTVNATDYFNNYHVCTVIADPKYVGDLPTPTATNSSYVESSTDPKYGTMSKYTGKPIELNGIEITEGDAWDYARGSAGDFAASGADADAAKYQLYSYYSGGGFVVDGNWYGTQSGSGSGTIYHSEYKHENVNNAVAYRDIPVEFNKCQLINNKAGYGGAVSTNGTVRFYNSMLASNLAYSGIDKDVDGVAKTSKNPNGVVSYPGVGGAVYLTKAIVAINTLFENNEAVDEDPQESGKTLDVGDKYNEPRTFHTLRSSGTIFPGAGACIYAGMHSDYIHVLNSDFVRNKANIYPAVFTANHNPRNVILNSVFWGNVGTYSGSQTKIPAGATIDVLLEDESGVVVPLRPNTIYNSVSDTGYDRNNYVWFSAYEEGRGPKAELKKDLRTKPFRIYTDAQPSELTPELGREVVSFDRIAVEQQNSNIIISSDNNALDGPNFGNPSHNAGIEGFAQDADFMPTRVNRLSDAGWGWIKQNADFTGFAELGQENFDEGIADSEHTNWLKHNPDKNLGGAYSYIYAYNGANTAKQPIGKTTYMLLNEAMGDDASMLRIAKMPPPILGENIVYIDLGVYEHKNEALQDKGGKHVHEIWVAPHEKLENGVADGSDWLHPTSDLQRAINTLLSNRCGCDRDKVIHLIEGEYAPLNYDSQFNYGFEVNTGGLNTSANNVYDDAVPTPSRRTTYKESFVKSLVFDGGYSNSITTLVNGKQQGIHNYEKFPSVITTAQTNGTSRHLFNVLDARQWYGCGPAQQVEQYSGVTTQSLLHPNRTNDDRTTYTPTVIPLIFEGITFENGEAPSRPASPTAEQTANGTGLGAAIYYPTQTFYRRKSDGAISYLENDTDRDTENPHVCYAPTLLTDGDHNLTTSITDAGNPYKLNIAECIFRLNGKENDTPASASALYAAAGSGPAVVYSSLFHSNYGAPVNGTDIKLINNTIALNGAKVDLTATGGTAANCALIGNIFWRNSGNMPAGATMDLANEYAVPNETMVTNNAITGTSLPSGNDELNSVNTNSTTGPGFVSDFYGAVDPNTATAAEKRTFDFHIPKPTSAVSEKVAADIFYNAVFGTSLSVDAAKEKMNIDGAVIRDLGYGLRLINDMLERGAYENQITFHRVLFCDPSLGNWSSDANNTSDNHGRIWAFAYPDRTQTATAPITPISAGTLQDAIDRAHMYFLANGSNDHSEAYVFIKGDSRILDAITIPDGVRVIGSIPQSFSENCGVLTETNITAFPDYEPSNEEIAAFITKVEQTRPGLLAPTGATRTLLKGASSTGSYPYGAVLDGVEITNYDTDADDIPDTYGTLTIDPVGSGLNPCVLRNAYVHDTDINVDAALLYNVFMENNHNGDGTSDVPQIGNYVLALNVTSLQNLVLHTPALASRMCLTDSDKAKHRDGIPDTPGTPAGYLLYQLDEDSHDLDLYADLDNLLVDDVIKVTLKRYVNPQTDRDLLGNPRRLNGAVDAGCFETWYLSGSRDVEAKYQPNKVPLRPDDTGVWQYYPHEGSMVYVTDGANLILDAASMNDLPTADVRRYGVIPNEYTDGNSDGKYDYTFSPYFFLIDEGASLYGQGVAVSMNYLALRRPVDEVGSVVSLPFAITADAADTYYTYNGTSRSAYNYDWLSADSPCWTAVDDAAPIAANTAFLYRPSATGPHTFIAGSHGGSSLYSEDKHGTFKAVTLFQHESTSADGDGSGPNKPNFTTKEDMGWNGIGLPYLVADYRTADKTQTPIHGTSDKYMMHIPHVMWLYGEFTDADGNPNGTYGYYHYNSWEDDSKGEAPFLNAGEGVFMQTSTLKASETLTFYRPVYTPKTVGGRTRAHDSRGIEEQRPGDPASAELLRTEYYTTGGVRLTAPLRGAVTICVDTYSDGSVRTRKKKR